MSENDIRKAQVSGFYSDIDLGRPNFTEDRVHEEERKLEGTRKTYSSTAGDTTYTVLESHINLDLEGFEDMNEETNLQELNFLIL